MQPKAEIEKAYETPDPWGYRSRLEDQARRRLLAVIADHYCGNAKMTLDVGCGEGFITELLPGEALYGYEISDNAAARFPKWLNRHLGTEDRKYDLVVCTGALYGHYDWRAMVDVIRRAASDTVITCAIKDWEVPEAIKLMPGRQVFEADFEYNPEDKKYIQKLRVFKL